MAPTRLHLCLDAEQADHHSVHHFIHHVTHCVDFGMLMAEAEVGAAVTLRLLILWFHPVPHATC